MTALLIYYFLFVTGALVLAIILYKFFDMFLDFISGLIHEITK